MLTSNYEFYVFSDNGVVNNLTPKQAMRVYDTVESKGYKAIGVTKDEMFSCDLWVNGRLSLDYTKMDNFKNDGLIANNVVSMLREHFERGSVYNG